MIRSKYKFSWFLLILANMLAENSEGNLTAKQTRFAETMTLFASSTVLARSYSNGAGVCKGPAPLSERAAVCAASRRPRAAPKKSIPQCPTQIPASGGL